MLLLSCGFDNLFVSGITKSNELLEIERRELEIERRELEIEERNKLLEIAIRVNEMSFASRVEELDHQSDWVLRRTFYTSAENMNTETDMNSWESEENSTGGSDETNSSSSH